MLQHLEPSAQLAAKEAELRSTLARLARVEPRRWLAPLAGPVFGLPPARAARGEVRAKKDWVVVGFRERAAPYVADSESARSSPPRRAS